VLQSHINKDKFLIQREIEFKNHLKHLKRHEGLHTPNTKNN